jgi:hypothetical protein
MGRLPLRRLVAPLAAILFVAGCDADGAADDVDLGEGPGAEAPAEPGETEPAEGGPGGDGDGQPARNFTGAGPDDDAVTSGLVDTTAATGGSWPIGAAGRVTWDVEGDELVLRDHAPADGWDAVVEEEDDDELELVFRRGDERWRYEVELDSGRLEIELAYDRADAPAGAYDLPDGGSFTFELVDDVLALTSLQVPDGWEEVERDESDDEFSFTLRAPAGEDGERRVEVEVEFNGAVELEIDYRVTGPLPG